MSLHNTQSISIAWRKGFNDTCVNFAAGFTRGIFKIYGFYDKFLKKYIAWKRSIIDWKNSFLTTRLQFFSAQFNIRGRDVLVAVCK